MLELLLSGRLVPLTLMPDWVADLAWFLPFRWTFYFPIEALVGDLSEPGAARAGSRCRCSGSSSGIGDLLARLAARDPALLGGGD